uniref:Uncharacterized protein n=1 Tax=Rhizophora mucronata TaxID=61149 RepID=A0A2P2NJR0_RHIMU
MICFGFLTASLCYASRARLPLHTAIANVFLLKQNRKTCLLQITICLYTPGIGRN